MERPEEVHLSREDGEALIERLERNTLTATDRHILVKVLTLYFWLVFTLQEAQAQSQTAADTPLWRVSQAPSPARDDQR